MDPPRSKKKFTEEEKQQLLANLDLEVEHRTRQFEGWLQDQLETWQHHAEGLVSRIPPLVRGVTMREFGEKWGGDVQACLRGIQRQRIAEHDGDVEIDKTARKRKWVASMEVEAGEASGSHDAEASRAVKNARLAATPKKTKPGSSTGPGTAQRARLQAATANRTPGTSRTMGRPTAPSQTPSKYLSAFPKGPNKPSSPIKPIPSSRRPPSSATFNPIIPKTPAYPRMPRRDENMLSVNGSPLTNPYALSADGTEDDEGNDNGKATEPRPGLQRKPSIVIRRDPSFSFAPSTTNGFHSRSTSQTNLLPGTSSTTHSRSNSQQSLTTPKSKPTSRSGSHSSLNPDSSSLPSSSSSFMTPSMSFASATVKIPTKDGHLLEFDPLQTSPDELDALEGITNSAKKAAREEMGRLVKATVEKWTIR